MATHTYQVQLADQDQSVEVNAEDFRVIDSSVIFYRHIMGDKANTHLFKLEDVSSVEIKDTSG